MPRKNNHYWTLSIRTDSPLTPLVRIFLILRKFRVSLVRMKVVPRGKAQTEIIMKLDFALSTRTDTVFRKIARLYDVIRVQYAQGTTLGKKKIILK